MVVKRPDQQERREYKRLHVNLAIVFRVDKSSKVRMNIEGKDIHATMIDLGEVGLSILSNYDIPEQAVLLMQFTLFRVEEDDVSFYGPMEILGEVKYRKSLSNSEYRLGIVFTKIEKDDKEEIARFVKESR
jgi:c-di-GMP-binding flagellar brake protein YcgR